jgi:hypothetical protein
VIIAEVAFTNGVNGFVEEMLLESVLAPFIIDATADSVAVLSTFSSALLVVVWLLLRRVAGNEAKYLAINEKLLFILLLNDEGCC